MTIFIASDHAGFALKEALVPHLTKLGHSVVDCGALELTQEDDYPDFIRKAAQGVSSDIEKNKAIVLGGSGQGEAMVGNRFAGVRAAVYYGGSLDIVRLAREHNDANMLSLGARFVTEEEAKEAVTLFLATPFSSDERHVRRIRKIDAHG